MNPKRKTSQEILQRLRDAQLHHDLLKYRNHLRYHIFMGVINEAKEKHRIDKEIGLAAPHHDPSSCLTCAFLDSEEAVAHRTLIEGVL